MAKREKSLTRAQKIAASKQANQDTQKSAPRRQGTAKAKSEAKTEVPAEQLAPKPTEVGTVTSMVSRAGRPTLSASYVQILAHRKPVVDRVKVVIATIAQSYRDSDKDDRDARNQRYELADETLDYLIDCFDNNGFSNPGDRLVFAWLMLDLLGPIGHRTDEILDLIEKTFHLRGQKISGKGLGHEIARRRERQQKRREDNGNKRQAA